MKSFFIHTSIIFSILLCISSCEIPEAFTEEYYDNTTNYIADFPMKAPTYNSDSNGNANLDTIDSWDWAWRGKTQNNFSYMELTDEGNVGTDIDYDDYTLSSTEKVWKLGLANLAKNPYFEDLAVPEEWVTDENVPTTAQVNIYSSLSEQHGKYLELTTIPANPIQHWAGFDPNKGILDNKLDTFVYRFLAKITSTSSELSYYIDTDEQKISLGGSYNILNDFSVEDNNTRLKFYKEGLSQDLIFDDIRIIRMDAKDNMRLRLLLSPKSTSPKLVAGKYEFSIWVCKPNDSAYCDEHEQRKSNPIAPFASKKVRLMIKQIGFLEKDRSDMSSSKTFEVSSTWTRLSLRQKSNLERFDESATGAVIELSIMPFDEQNPDVGSVLIAKPELRFFINGY